jgi:hypothetical protein
MNLGCSQIEMIHSQLNASDASFILNFADTPMKANRTPSKNGQEIELDDLLRSPSPKKQGLQEEEKSEQ